MKASYLKLGADNPPGAPAMLPPTDSHGLVNSGPGPMGTSSRAAGKPPIPAALCWGAPIRDTREFRCENRVTH